MQTAKEPGPWEDVRRKDRHIGMQAERVVGRKGGIYAGSALGREENRE